MLLLFSTNILDSLHFKLPRFSSELLSVAKRTFVDSAVFVHEGVVKELDSFLQKDVLILYGKYIFIKLFGFSEKTLSLGGGNLFLLNV